MTACEQNGCTEGVIDRCLTCHGAISQINHHAGPDISHQSQYFEYVRNCANFPHEFVSEKLPGMAWDDSEKCWVRRGEIPVQA